MVYWIIALLVWLIGIYVSYTKVFKSWVEKPGSSTTKFESVWFSFIWPLIVPLYLIHVIHNKL